MIDKNLNYGYPVQKYFLGGLIKQLANVSANRAPTGPVEQKRQAPDVPTGSPNASPPPAPRDREGFDFGAPANLGDTHYDPQLDTTYTYQEKSDGRGGSYSGWDITEGTGGTVTGGPALPSPLPRPDNPFLNPEPPVSTQPVLPKPPIQQRPDNPFLRPDPVLGKPDSPFLPPVFADPIMPAPAPPVFADPIMPKPTPPVFADPIMPAPIPPVFGPPPSPNPFPYLPRGGQGGRTYGGIGSYLKY